MQTVQIEITSDSPGVGKTTIGGIVKDALERCGYYVSVSAIAHPGHTLLGSKELEKKEPVTIELQKEGRLLDHLDESHPYADVELIVHG